MTNCPKCGNCRILGPSYTKDALGERLTYRCLQCGYATTTPTNDAQKPIWPA